MVDLVIKNSNLVIPKNGIVSASIAVKEGIIVGLYSESATPSAEKIIDAKGKFVLPGVIDPHVHYGLLNPLDQDVRTETQSAAIGGVTTVLRYHRAENSYLNIFEKEKEIFEKNALTDFSFNYGILMDEHLEEVGDYVNKLGVTGFKYFLNYQTGYNEAKNLGFNGIDDGYLCLGLKKIASLGPPARAFLHCENIEIISHLQKGIRETKREDLAAWTECRPNFTEEESISKAIILAKITKCPIEIVHLTTAEGLRAVAEAKKEGLDIVAETCPPYLTFTKDDSKIGMIGKLVPPLRSEKDVEELWQGIANGAIDTIGSDHSAKSRSNKVGKGDIWSATGGVPGSATMLPVMLSEGVNKRGITIEKVAEICSYNTAKIFGLYPKKGTIAVGSDADFTIVDLEETKEVNSTLLRSSSDFTLYEGWKLKGWPTTTILRGNIVVENGELVGKPGIGRYIRRKLED